MTQDEKVAIQTLIVERLQADAERHPTLLIDTLLSGDGVALVHSIVAQEEALARNRAAILGRLLAVFKPAEPPAARPSVAEQFAALTPEQRNAVLLAAMTPQEGK